MPSPNLRTAWYLILHCRIGAGNRAAAVALTLRWTRWYLRSSSSTAAAAAAAAAVAVWWWWLHKVLVIVFVAGWLTIAIFRTWTRTCTPGPSGLVEQGKLGWSITGTLAEVLRFSSPKGNFIAGAFGECRLRRPYDARCGTGRVVLRFI